MLSAFSTVILSAPTDRMCTGTPKMYDGKLCASMSTYYDCTKGTCQQLRSEGSATPSKDPKSVCYTAPAFVSKTAALNTANLNPSNPSKGGECEQSGCGSCYKLTNIKTGVSDVFKIGNRCGDGYDSHKKDVCNQKITADDCAKNTTACASDPLNLNKGGYAAHFDLMDLVSQINLADPTKYSAGSLSPYFVQPADRLNWATTISGSWPDTSITGTELTFEQVDCSHWNQRGNVTEDGGWCAAPGPGCVADYQQCGGVVDNKPWTGPTTCCNPALECIKKNEYYSGCN